MQTTRLQTNERAPDVVDFIEIEMLNGKFRVIGIICYDESGKLGAHEFPSFEEAEAAGFAWARENCVGHLYVATVYA